MRLLIYSHHFAPSVGGVETIVMSLALGLVSYRRPNGTPLFEITVVTEIPAGDAPDSALPFRVVRQPSRSELRSLIRGSDLIHLAGPALLPLIYSLLARRRIVIEHHGFQTICPTGQLFQEPQLAPCPGHFMQGAYANCLRCRTDANWPAAFRLWALTFLRRYLCKHVAANIAPTAWLASLLKLPRTTVIPHGIEPLPVLWANSHAEAPPQIVFLGRLVSAKGVRVLLEAARHLKQRSRPFTVVLVGDGPDRAHLEKLANALGIQEQVRFAGRLTHSQMQPIFEHAAILVAPSLGGEVFGLSVAENMFRGVPIVASDLGSYAEVLNGTGLLFPTGDAGALAERLTQLLDDPSLRTRLAAEARHRVLDFCSLERMIEAHVALYRKLGGPSENT